jgi:hypothetical protein
MKKQLISLFVMAFLAIVPASAQGIFFGVKGGMNNTRMGIDMEGISTKSGYGWFVGPTLKIDILPFFGVQAAALYNQSNCKILDEKIKQKSILVPIDARLNLKFNSEKSTGIYLSTGPQFGFNVGDADYNIFGSNSSEAKENVKSTFQLKKSIFSWNFGIGVMASKHFELGALYSLGLTTTGELEQLTKDDKPKSRMWNISATWFF